MSVLGLGIAHLVLREQCLAAERGSKQRPKRIREPRLTAMPRCRASDESIRPPPLRRIDRRRDRRSPPRCAAGESRITRVGGDAAA